MFRLYLSTETDVFRVFTVWILRYELIATTDDKPASARINAGFYTFPVNIVGIMVLKWLKLIWYYAYYWMIISYWIMKYNSYFIHLLQRLPLVLDYFTVYFPMYGWLALCYGYLYSMHPCMNYECIIIIILVLCTYNKIKFLFS